MIKKIGTLFIVLICIFIAIYFFAIKDNIQEVDEKDINTSNDINIENNGKEGKQMNNKINLNVNNNNFVVNLENNSSSQEFVNKLQQGDIVIKAHDYGNFEKVGNLGFSLPTNDTQITTKPGDVILYQGNQITVYYDTNTWSFTKLGEIEGVSKQELKNILGDGDVTLTFSLYK